MKRLLTEEDLNIDDSDRVSLNTHAAETLSGSVQDGWTALHLASVYGWHDIIAPLIEHGAGVNTANKVCEWRAFAS